MGAGEWGRARVVVERWRRVLAVPRPSLYRAERERRGAGRELRGMPPMAAAIGAPEVCGWRCDCCEGRAGDVEGREGAWSSRRASLVAAGAGGDGLLLAVAVAASGWRERGGEEGEEDDMWGPRVSDRGDEVYVFVYVAARPRLCPYVFNGIFVANEEL